MKREGIYKACMHWYWSYWWACTRSVQKLLQVFKEENQSLNFCSDGFIS